MNKQDPAKGVVAAETGKTNAEAGRSPDALLGLIEKQTRNGGEVGIAGFGRSKISERPVLIGTNPRTGKTTEIPAYKTPGLRVGKSLRNSAKVAP